MVVTDNRGGTPPNRFDSRAVKSSDNVIYPANRFYDRRTIQQGWYVGRNHDTRPYCTYCKRLGHLAYNCFQRLPPMNVTPLQGGQVYVLIGNRYAESRQPF